MLICTQSCSTELKPNKKGSDRLEYKCFQALHLGQTKDHPRAYFLNDPEFSYSTLGKYALTRPFAGMVIELSDILDYLYKWFRYHMNAQGKHISIIVQ